MERDIKSNLIKTFDFSKILSERDKYLAFLTILLTFILIIYIYIKINHPIYILTGILTLFACLVWLVIRKKHSFSFTFQESRNLTYLCASLFFIIFTISILLVYFRTNLYERPLLYFISISLMVVILILEIMSSNKKALLFILIQIILLGINIAWSQLLIFPGILGVDPWYHSFLTNRIISSGHIPDGFAYSKLPLFHLEIAVASFLTNLPYKFSAMISVSLVQFICNSLFIFLISYNLINNYKVGLLSSLMVIIANHHIFMSYWSIPNGFGAIFIPIAIFILLFKYSVNFSRSFLIYMIVFISIIFTHTIVAIFMAIVLFIIWLITNNFYFIEIKASNIRLSILIPLSFTVAMLAWWNYASKHIFTLAELIKWGFTIDLFVRTPKELRNYISQIPFNEQLLINLGMFLYFTISFIGVYYLVSAKGNKITLTMASIAMTPLIISFFSLITGHSVIEHRWLYFSQLLLAIPLAIAFMIFLSFNNKRKYLSCLTIGIILIMSFLLVMSSEANIDNNFISSNLHFRNTLTESEINSLTTILNKWSGPLKTDVYFAGSQKHEYPQISAFCDNIYNDNFHTLENNIILIREEIIDKPFKIYSSINKLNFNLNNKLEMSGFSRIYDSGSVIGYRI